MAQLEQLKLKLSSQSARFRIFPKCSSGLPALFICSATLLLLVVTSQVNETEARYLQPASRYADAANHRDFRLADNAMPMLRRESFDDGDADDESGADSDDSDDADQNAAASYRNQDEDANQNGGGGGGGGNGGQNDGYEDSEPDAAYEETPVEREGQADLERFFDDHLGASDRDGMDKENLPTNLIASLAPPPPPPSPKLDNFGTEVLRVSPPISVENPNVKPALLTALPTIQTTSFIRLPEERKVIVTNQITRNTIGRPIVSSDRNDDNADHEISTKAAAAAAAKAAVDQNHPSSVVLNLEPLEEEEDNRRQQKLFGDLSASDNQAGQQDGRGDKLKAIGSEVVLTENEDDDRVYVTNATNKPFRIDALGGYDPEADFRDAAKELDTYGSDTKPKTQGLARLDESSEASSLGSQRVASNQDDDQDGDQNQNHREGQSFAPAGKQEISFTESPDADMYEDASETDEVTFDQDDPYQTDLEAEMRAQDYDRIGRFAVDSPVKSSSTELRKNVVADNGQIEPGNLEQGGDSADGRNFNNDDGKVDPNDDDADIDSEYKSVQPEAGANQAAPSKGKSKSDRRQDDGDESQWVNDGVDEMDIPSQSHQNFILDKAAKHDAQVRRKAELEAEAEAQRQEAQQPEEDQTSNDEEESQRMPNANYLRNDLIEDDSGYAA